MIAFPHHLAPAAIRSALEEDLGLAGDITTNAIIPESATSSARLVSRSPGVLAGLPLAVAAFEALDPAFQCHIAAPEGTVLSEGQLIAELEGKTRAILSAERVALNFIQHLSGIASMTASFVVAVQGTPAKIVCTRKTTPGLRAFEKYAVAAGGGINHRFGLFD